MTTPTTPGDREPDTEVLDDLEFQSAVMVRNFELLRRRSDIYGELGRAEYLLLRTLDSIGPSDIGGLAKAVGLDPSTAGRQVNGMESSGLVERSASPSDRRRSIIAPTSKGRRLMSAVRATRRQATAELLAEWPAADRRQLAAMFRRWNDTIAQAYLS